MGNGKEAPEQIKPFDRKGEKKADVRSLEEIFEADGSLASLAGDISKSLEEVLSGEEEIIQPLADYMWKELEKRGLEIPKEKEKREEIFEDFVTKKFVPNAAFYRIMNFVAQEDFDGGIREIRRIASVLESAFGEKGEEKLSKIKAAIESLFPPEIRSLLNPESEEARSRVLKREARIREAARLDREAKEQKQEEKEEPEESVAAGGIEEGGNEKSGGAAQETFVEKIIRLTDEQIREGLIGDKEAKKEPMADNVNIHHPELRPGEVFYVNVLRDPPPGYPGFETIGYKTKRKGKKAYHPLGIELKEFAPVFVKREEYKNEYGKRP